MRFITKYIIDSVKIKLKIAGMFGGIIALVLYSCDNSSGSGGIEENGNSLQIESVSVSPGRKSALNSYLTPVTGGGIGIFLFSDSSVAGGKDNVHYIYNNSNWDVSPDESFPVYLNNDSSGLCAYYPYNSDYSDGSTVLTSQLYSEDKDLCRCGDVYAKAGEAVSFVLYHAYAKLALNFIHVKTYSGNCVVSRINIVNDSLRQSCAFSIKTGEYGNGIAGNIDINPQIASIAPGSYESVVLLMVPVAYLRGRIILNFTVDGKNLSTTLDADETGINSLNAGGIRTLNINISDNLTVISGK